LKWVELGGDWNFLLELDEIGLSGLKLVNDHLPKKQTGSKCHILVLMITNNIISIMLKMTKWLDFMIIIFYI